MNGRRLSVSEYVEELARKLGLSRDMADILDEVRDHLLESVSGYREEGLDEEAATAEAVRDLGEPDYIATSLRPVVAQQHVSDHEKPTTIDRVKTDHLR